MTLKPRLSLTVLGFALLSACGGLPQSNIGLDTANREFRTALSNPEIRRLAGAELKRADDALSKANDAWHRQEAPSEVDHLAYLARQRVVIAQIVSMRKAAENSVASGDSDRPELALTSRTDEADFAGRAAALAQRNTDPSSPKSSFDARKAMDADSRSPDNEAQLKRLNARKTDRGLVMTLGDILFDTDQSVLKTGERPNIERLVAFLNQHRDRFVLIEGFTDSTGGPAHNLALSTRRADAVRSELIRLGVGRDRIATYGYGSAHPVADNGTHDGRLLNRRVEVVLSEGIGVNIPRP